MNNRKLLPFRWTWMLILISLSIAATPAIASTAEPVNFSLVVTDSAGKLRANAPVELMVELTTGSLDGEVQYAETHEKATDGDGIVNFFIGKGQVADPKYVFDNFDIAQGKNFMRLSVKEAGGWRLLMKTQVPNVPEIRKWLFANEKSNTVIAVMSVIWVGIVVYLLLSGRKLRRLEKQLAELKERNRNSA